jgi:hypothetical protein
MLKILTGILLCLVCLTGISSATTCDEEISTLLSNGTFLYLESENGVGYARIEYDFWKDKSDVYKRDFMRCIYEGFPDRSIDKVILSKMQGPNREFINKLGICYSSIIVKIYR